jgi:hypothetical protein
VPAPANNANRMAARSDRAEVDPRFPGVCIIKISLLILPLSIRPSGTGWINGFARE